MYLAPLNYDRYFKKIFSEKRFAKRFLEDFFDVSIEEIDLMATEHRVTDDASVLEFDFRCKINGAYVIIDMQQWFKPDVVHRFYTYHCASTVLQLGDLPFKSIALEENKEKKVKDYSEILPVITLVWMVDDTFGFKDDYAAYSMTPEVVTDFVRNKLWQNPEIKSLLAERNRVLAIMEKKNRSLDFLAQNRLIYVFQKNVIRNASNEKTARRYNAWFEFAEATKNKENKPSDFEKFEHDELFSEIMRRICKEILTEEDFTYIDNFAEYTERVKRYDSGIFREGEKIGVEKGIGIGVEKGIGIGVEKGIGIGVEKAAQNGILAGLSNEVIKLMTKLTDEQIDNIREELKKSGA